jgi:hypothetical protein
MSELSNPSGSAHDAFAEMLAGYVDDELTPDERERVDQHVRECLACRRELRAQTVVHERLLREAESPASSGLSDRVMERIGALQRGSGPGGPNQSRRLLSRIRPALAAAGWLAAAALAGLWIWTSHRPGRASGGMSMGPPIPVVMDRSPGPISAAVINQFEEVNLSDLPTGVDLNELEKELPFGVPALHSPHMRLLSAWRTEVSGVPAAALAYRCHDRLVIQYVVSEREFFRHPQVRQAIAKQGLYAVGTGTVTTVAWPDKDSGSFLVGEFSASDLAAMRL